MGTEAAEEIYRQRGVTAEFPNATCRNRDLKQFNVRGFVKAKAVTLWQALAHNFQRTLDLRKKAGLAPVSEGKGSESGQNPKPTIQSQAKTCRNQRGGEASSQKKPPKPPSKPQPASKWATVEKVHSLTADPTIPLIFLQPAKPPRPRLGNHLHGRHSRSKGA